MYRSGERCEPCNANDHDEDCLYCPSSFREMVVLRLSIWAVQKLIYFTRERNTVSRKDDLRYEHSYCMTAVYFSLMVAQLSMSVLTLYSFADE